MKKFVAYVISTLDFLIDAHVRLFIFAEEIVPVRAY